MVNIIWQKTSPLLYFKGYKNLNNAHFLNKQPMDDGFTEKAASIIERKPDLLIHLRFEGRNLIEEKGTKIFDEKDRLLLIGKRGEDNNIDFYSPSEVLYQEITSEIKFKTYPKAKEFLTLLGEKSRLHEEFLETGIAKPFLVGDGFETIYMATEQGLFVPSDLVAFYKLFLTIGIWNFHRSIDLGTGTGETVLLASFFGLKSVGIELDQFLYEKSLDLKRKILMEGIKEVEKAELINGDFFSHNLSSYDFIYVPQGYENFRFDDIENKILDEIRKGAIVVNPAVKFEKLKLREEIEPFFIHTKG